MFSENYQQIEKREYRRFLNTWVTFPVLLSITPIMASDYSKGLALLVFLTIMSIVAIKGSELSFAVKKSLRKMSFSQAIYEYLPFLSVGVILSLMIVGFVDKSLIQYLNGLF